ncbi:MAG: hypothetical protein GY761_03885 [Hyphomicrobiales bacterium]|nr:hypothetical protein [Hyphomicrobiales bacterium]
MNSNIFKIDPSSTDLFGELIAEWSRGITPRPNTYEKFLGQLDGKGISYSEPDHRLPDLQLQIIPMADNVLTLTIPTPLMIDNAIDSANTDTDTYPLPKAYELVFKDNTKVPGDELNADDRKTILMARIGDYSVSHCQ